MGPSSTTKGNITFADEFFCLILLSLYIKIWTIRWTKSEQSKLLHHIISDYYIISETRKKITKQLEAKHSQKLILRKISLNLLFYIFMSSYVVFSLLQIGFPWQMRTQGIKENLQCVVIIEASFTEDEATRKH